MNSYIKICIEIVATTLVAAWVIWKVWPEMKANNIFIKNPFRYKQGPARLLRKLQHKKDIFGVAVTAGVAGLVLSIYRVIKLKYEGPNYRSGYIDYLPARFFFISLALLIGLFFHILNDDPENDLFRNFKYALKAWLTGILASPIIVLLINNHTIANSFRAFYLYIKIAIISNGLACPAFITLIFAANYFSKKPWKTPKKKLFMMIYTGAVFILLLLLAPLGVSYGLGGLSSWLSQTIITGLGMAYYSMDQTIYSDETAHLTNTID
ncbi:hypothetical protein [Mucilaginibacter paludis]|nr:hypothetical protein [Mucilaginibacter paludis]